MGFWRFLCVHIVHNADRYYINWHLRTKYEFNQREWWLKSYKVNPWSAVADPNWTPTSHDVFVHYVPTLHVCLCYFYTKCGNTYYRSMLMIVLSIYIHTTGQFRLTAFIGSNVQCSIYPHGIQIQCKLIDLHWQYCATLSDLVLLHRLDEYMNQIRSIPVQHMPKLWNYSKSYRGAC
jgi:hypothetical protein